jgi:hypothetical protein
MKKLLMIAALLPAAAKADDRNLAYEIIAGLTTEVGQRLAGTEREATARAWAVEKFKALGFQNIRIEPFDSATLVDIERAIRESRLGLNGSIEGKDRKSVV